MTENLLKYVFNKDADSIDELLESLLDHEESENDGIVIEDSEDEQEERIGFLFCLCRHRPSLLSTRSRLFSLRVESFCRSETRQSSHSI